MLKTKSEFEVPHYQTTHFNGQKKRMVVDSSNHSLFPVPHLPTCTVEALPREVTNTRASLPSYIPAKNRAVPAPIQRSDSKYSAARVRERITADGTVMPVSEPKKSKDGLYLRPAGRTRKGMEWDAIRGIWVPTGSQE